MDIIQRFTLTGSVAVITGGGRGIGRAIALAYAQAGADVVLAARTLSDVEAVADAVRDLGRRALAVQCDVNDAEQRAALITRAREHMGRITHLVNNAGGAGPNDPLTLTVERFEEIMRFNVSSGYHLTQLCVPHMRDAGGGNIINITSGAARYAQNPVQRLWHRQSRPEPYDALAGTGFRAAGAGQRDCTGANPHRCPEPRAASAHARKHDQGHPAAQPRRT